MSGYDWNLFGDKPYEIHHKDCPDPEGDAHGDANATGVTKSEDDPEYDVSCQCLDPLLGSDRDVGGEA